MVLVECKGCRVMIPNNVTECPRCGRPLTNHITSGDYMLPISTRLGGGRYRIEQYLASGGFGNTYIATDLTFDDRVAIKEFFMRGVTQRDSDFTVRVNLAENEPLYHKLLEKFKKEALRLRQLNNSHIVRVQDYFEANGTAYYVMDYIQGESLAARMKRTGKPLSEAEALNYFLQMLDALQTVHAQGLSHLDIKPANIMVDNDGKAILIDFGASKQTEGGDATTITSVAYTNGYAPNEQMEQNVAQFGPWTDIYALGATLYALLNNRKPPLPSAIFSDPTPSKKSSLPFSSQVSSATQKLIIKMMAVNSNDRPQSIEEVRKLLVQNNPKPPRKKDFLNRYKWFVVSLIGILIVLGGIWLWQKLKPSPVPDDDNSTETTEVLGTMPENSKGGEDPQENEEGTEKSKGTENSKGGEDPQENEEETEKSEGMEDSKETEKYVKQDLDYGTFEGTKDDYLPGVVNGRLTFTSPHLIDSYDSKQRMAEPGDYVEGNFSEGHLLYGTWYAADGTEKERLRFGKNI